MSTTRTLMTEEALDQYIATALWSSIDVDPATGETINLDDGYELADGVASYLSVELADFLSDPTVQGLIAQTDMDLEQAAHDFWLTRNHHGAGFWDRGLGAAGDELTRLAQVYGGCDLYLGDDGMVHAS
jgi:hypothetical protein